MTHLCTYQQLLDREPCGPGLDQLHQKIGVNPASDYKIQLADLQGLMASDILWGVGEQLGGLSESQAKIISVKVALKAGQLVLPLFEKHFPQDHRPRNALETVEQWLAGATVDLDQARADAYWATDAAAALAARATTDAAVAAADAALAAAAAADAAVVAVVVDDAAVVDEGIESIIRDYTIDLLAEILDI